MLGENVIQNITRCLRRCVVTGKETPERKGRVTASRELVVREPATNVASLGPDHL